MVIPEMSRRTGARAKVRLGRDRLEMRPGRVPSVEEGRSPVDEPVEQAEQLLDVLAEAREEAEQARDLYEEAARRWADYGFVLEEGQAHLGLTRCLIAMGNNGAASEPLKKARVIFDRLGARSLMEEVARLEEASALTS
jgi:hypothetical protein